MNPMLDLISRPLQIQQEFWVKWLKIKVFDDCLVHALKHHLIVQQNPFQINDQLHQTPNTLYDLILNSFQLQYEVNDLELQ